MNCPECGYPMRYVKDLNATGKQLYECQNNTCPHYKKTGRHIQGSK